MIRNINVSRHTGERLSFEVDLEAGEVTGSDAELVRRWLVDWGGVAILYGTQPVEAPDPVHSLRDLAVMLANYGYWNGMSEEMLALIPTAEDLGDGRIA